MFIRTPPPPEGEPDHARETVSVRPKREKREKRAPVRALLALSRPKQWLKNPIIIVLPLISLPRWDARVLLDLAWASALFVLASIAVYVFNDIRDAERDRLHPHKRARPIAAGRVGTGTAWAFLAAVVLVLGAGIVLAHVGRAWPVCAYLALNLAYSLRLKHIALIDAFAVAIGFVLRAEQGYTAIGVRPSAWLLLAVLTLCLLLVMGKRRRELAEGALGHRPALQGYSVQLLDYLMLMSATLSAVAYLLFLRSETSAGTDPTALIVLTVPCAVFAIFRYLQLLVVGEGGGDPIRTLFGDRPLVASGLVWAAVIVGSLVFFHLRLPTA
jgi:decaprenyl-phosphate phosphoribosyltransferase